MGKIVNEQSSRLREDFYQQCCKGLKTEQILGLSRILAGMTDEQLSSWLSIGEKGIIILQARVSHDEAFKVLIGEYKKFIAWAVNYYAQYLDGAERGDLESAALISMYTALSDFCPQKGNYRFFLKDHIRWGILREITKSMRKNDRLLNDSRSLENSIDEEMRALEEKLSGVDGRYWLIEPEGSPCLEELLANPNSSEVVRFIEEEAKDLIRLKPGNELTPLEKTVAVLTNRNCHEVGIAYTMSLPREQVAIMQNAIREKGYLIGCSKRQREVVRLYLQGLSYEEIADKLKMTGESVHGDMVNVRWVYEIKRPKKKTLTPVQAAVKEAIDRGLCYDEMEATLPYTRREIYEAAFRLKQKDIEGTPSKPLFGQIESRVKEYMDQGLSLNQIAQRMPNKKLDTIQALIRRVKRKLKEESADLTPDELVVVSRYKEGKSNTDIAEELGLKPGQVKRIIRKAKRKGLIQGFRPKVIDSSGKKETLNEAEKAVLRLWRKGLSRKDIAKRMDRSVQAIDCYLTRLRKKGFIEKPLLTPFQQQVVDLASTGLNHIQIGKKIGKSSAEIRLALIGAAKKGVVPNKQPVPAESSDSSS